jgi:hypothetical protein
VTREEKKLRRVLVKDEALQMKSAAAASGWKHAAGFVFQEHSGWFIELTSGTHPDQATTTARLYVKPMALDPVFWDMVGLPENARQPLSFRARGAWTCSSPDVAELVFSDAGLDAAGIVARVLHWAAEEIAARGDDWTVETFVDRIVSHPRQIEAFSWLPALTAGLVLAGRPDLAREQCLAAQRAGESGGFVAGSDTFPDMAIAWIDRTQAELI